jgi:hypothetical protein
MTDDRRTVNDPHGCVVPMSTAPRLASPPHACEVGKAYIGIASPWFAGIGSVLPASLREEIPWVADETGSLAMQEQDSYHNSERKIDCDLLTHLV